MKLCLVALVLSAGGCDMAFGLVRGHETSVCGPFGTPVEVPFDDALLAAGVHDFSVDATGQLGMATANLRSGVLPAWRGPHALKLNPDGVWTQDLARDKDVLNSLDGAHMQSDGKAIGWTDATRGATLFEYRFAPGPMKWSQLPGQIENVLTDSAHAGNVIATPDGVLRHLVEILIPESAPFVNKLQIYEKLADMSWKLTAQTNAFRTAVPSLNVSGAVMTMAHDRMIYTANVGKEMTGDVLAYRIFAGIRVDDQFEQGGELVIEGAPAAVGYSEPWINDDCTTLYYRQDDTTWMTTQVTQ